MAWRKFCRLNGCFSSAVASGKPMSPYLATFADGYRVAVIIDAMRKSSESGRRIELD